MLSRVTIVLLATLFVAACGKEEKVRVTASCWGGNDPYVLVSVYMNKDLSAAYPQVSLQRRGAESVDQSWEFVGGRWFRVYTGFRFFDYSFKRRGTYEYRAKLKPNLATNVAKVDISSLACAE